MTTRITDTHDPDITVTLDSGSHINVQRHPRWAPADQWLSGTPGAPAGG